MSTVAEKRAYLNARLAALVAEKQQVEYALSVLDDIDVPTTSKGGIRRRSTSGSGLNTIDTAVKIIDGDPKRTWRVQDVLDEMVKLGWGEGILDTTNALRTSLGRAVDRGLIGRGEHGEYTSLTPANPPAATSDPDPDPWSTPAPADEDPWGTPARAFREEPPF